MSDVVAIIAPGEMGSAVGRRLIEHGARVITSLEGRGKASIARAERAGFAIAETDAQLVQEAGFVFSIVPPGAALGLAERLVPVLAATVAKPIYVDCNAVAPTTAERIGAIIAPTGCRYVDAGIIGPPPSASARTVFYASGAAAGELTRLGDRGLTVRVLDGPIGAASALKMSYAGITKGVTALGAAMMLGAERAGAAAALRQELAESQAPLLAYLTRQVPAMFPKSYRWVAEMEEIAVFLTADAASSQIYRGMARLYQRFADELGTAEELPPQGELAALLDFCREAKG
jgi:3-hydroxyisobutyrate dehydrogenase-like beta-hydroxyacid dehydrogenase